MDIELLRLHKAAEVCHGAPISHLRLRTGTRSAELPPWSLAHRTLCRTSDVIDPHWTKPMIEEFNKWAASQGSKQRMTEH
jgi:hypothetical protein